MPKNRFFNFTNLPKEQSLISGLKRESIEIFGQDMYYIKRDSSDYNALLGDDLFQNYKNATLICLYPENIENFGSNKEFMAKFGFTLQDTCNFLLHKDEFKLTGLEKPEPGDLIKWPTTNRLFKINFVDYDYQFYQLGQNSVYQLQCELFKYSSENIETNIKEIDIFKEFQNNDTIDNDPVLPDNNIINENIDDIIIKE